MLKKNILINKISKGITYLNTYTDAKKVRFVFAGVWNSVSGLIIFWLLTVLVNDESSYLKVLVLTYLINGINSFFVQKYFVWKTIANTRIEFPIFVAINVTSIFVNFGILKYLLAHTELKPLVAQIISIALVACINFMIFDRFVFIQKRHNET